MISVADTYPAAHHLYLKQIFFLLPFFLGNWCQAFNFREVSVTARHSQSNYYIFLPIRTRKQEISLSFFIKWKAEKILNRDISNHIKVLSSISVSIPTEDWAYSLASFFSSSFSEYNYRIRCWRSCTRN